MGAAPHTVLLSYTGLLPGAAGVVGAAVMVPGACAGALVLGLVGKLAR